MRLAITGIDRACLGLGDQRQVGGRPGPVPGLVRVAGAGLGAGRPGGPQRVDLLGLLGQVLLEQRGQHHRPGPGRLQPPQPVQGPGQRRGRGDQRASQLQPQIAGTQIGHAAAPPATGRPWATYFWSASSLMCIHCHWPGATSVQTFRKTGPVGGGVAFLLTVWAREQTPSSGDPGQWSSVLGGGDGRTGHRTSPPRRVLHSDTSQARPIRPGPVGPEVPRGGRRPAHVRRSCGRPH